MAKKKEREKNPHAVALGKLGGPKGGRARAEALSPKRRAEISREAANTRWARVKAAEKKKATAKRKAAKVRKARTAARHAEAAEAGKVKTAKRSSKPKATKAARKPIKTRGKIKTKAPARKVTKKKAGWGASSPESLAKKKATKRSSK